MFFENPRRIYALLSVKRSGAGKLLKWPVSHRHVPPQATFFALTFIKPPKGVGLTLTIAGCNVLSKASLWKYNYSGTYEYGKRQDWKYDDK